MKTIKFAEDFPKLQEYLFTTIRTPPKPLRIGTECNIQTPTGEFKAILVMKRKESIKDIETSLLLEDTNTHSREEAMAALREYYPDLEEDSEVQILWFVPYRGDD